MSGGESEEEEDAHMHRLRPSRAARAESVSSGEDDEEDEGFHLLTAENLFSTLLHRVRMRSTTTIALIHLLIFVIDDLNEPWWIKRWI